MTRRRLAPPPTFDASIISGRRPELWSQKDLIHHMRYLYLSIDTTYGFDSFQLAAVSTALARSAARRFFAMSSASHFGQKSWRPERYPCLGQIEKVGVIVM